MGVYGLSMFMNRNDYFKIHQLKDTVVVIDGYNLVYEQFFNYQKHINDHMYGGDYDVFARHVKQFFKNLHKCNIHPIVVFDGALDPSLEKLQTILKRVDTVLNNAHKIYANNCFIEGVLPSFADIVTRIEIEKLNIPVFQTSYEADQTIIQIAYDLECPIVSNDSDFLLYNLSGGIVNLHSLFNYDVVVHRDSDENNFYLKCHYYRIENLRRSFPKINLDLVQIIGFILGNDYVDTETIEMLIRRISSHKDRQKLIMDVFIWISKHNSLKSLIDHIDVIQKNKNHPLIDIINKHFVSLEKSINHDENYLINHLTYLDKIKYKLFLGNVNLPQCMQSKFICKQIHCRLLSIMNVRMDWCRPLVEDFSFSQSSYETANKLMCYIYGILRKQDKNVANIKRYSRKNNEFKAQSIKPIIDLNEKLLPKLSEIIKLNEQERKNIFFFILQIDPEIYDSILEILNVQLKKIISFDYSMIIPFSSMLIALLYMLRNFHHHIWLEFVYSIYINLWFTGYICCNNNGPLFLKLDSTNRNILQNNFNKFSTLPVLSSSNVYKPRVVHFYNSFQICVDYIDFLSQILNLKNIFNTDSMLYALKGTFIYNLTVDLCSRPKPFLYLQQLFQRQNFKPLEIFIEIFNIILNKSERYVLKKNNSTLDSDIVPKSLLNKLTNIITPNDQYFIRATDFTSKKTHLKSQKLKLIK